MGDNQRKQDYRVEYGEEWKPEKTSKWFWFVLFAILGVLIAFPKSSQQEGFLYKVGDMSQRSKPLSE
ncbi:hypothetical protein D3C72_1131400 [compost metagenome]